MASAGIVRANALAASSVAGRLLGVEGGCAARAVHELALRVREVQSDQDAVSDDPTPGDEKVADVARGRAGQHDVDLVLLGGQKVLAHGGVVEHHEVARAPGTTSP